MKISSPETVEIREHAGATGASKRRSRDRTAYRCLCRHRCQRRSEPTSLTYSCPGDSGSYVIKYRVFTPGDAAADDHSNIVNYRLGGQTGQMVLDGSDTEFTAGHGSFAASTAQFGAMGVEHILSWNLVASRLSFNVGIEAGQALLLLVAFPLILLVRRTRRSVPVLRGATVAVAAFGLLWFIERFFLA